ncbi:caspase domain-containing protein [Trametes punicea]|nr:caspase domain-containing protein [Trametes punicea]
MSGHEHIAGNRSHHLINPPTSVEAVKRALVIGINYTGRTTDLRWCQRDAGAWCELLKTQYGYRDEEITLMVDAPGHRADLQPTRMNILKQICRLVQPVKEGSGSRLVFFYSGHAGQIPTDSSTEEDGYDECEPT